jgi:lysozyme family protein
MTPLVDRLLVANGTRWQIAKITTHAVARINHVAERLVSEGAKHAYQQLSAATTVPWWTIAVIHEREASQNWHDSIAQGDPWNQRSIHVPRNRGPFVSWIAAGIDALTECPPYAAHWTDWSAAGALTLLEQYNGLGYAGRGIASPYVWAGTDQYQAGKYLSDGHFDPHAVDQQLGCACLLREMMVLDSSIAAALGPEHA